MTQSPPNSSPSIAIVMTCHNRRDITLRCLQQLFSQTIPVDVYLVDDGSSDGTTHAILNRFPSVNIITGSGDLFWAGGMRQAFAEAMKKTYAHYLWLNDDTMLAPDALTRLLLAQQQLIERGQNQAIVIGSTRDEKNQKPTYGGAMQSKQWYSNKFEFVGVVDELRECETFFGNCVLIPQSVVDRVGNIDPTFIHTLGDLDYGLRARQQGCSIWIAPGTIGTCSQNLIDGSWADTELPLLDRLRKVTQIKGFPLRPWTVFCRRHSGRLWFMYWLLPYLRAVIGYRNLDASPTFCTDVE
jgi:GT2 family glycosyltransferase